MRIHQLSYHNKRLGWSLQPIEFANLTLLVGVSGVGKTRILRSILALKRIADGQSLRGVSWDLEFSGANGVRYKWTGEFETPAEAASDSLFDEEVEFDELPAESKSKPKLLAEALFANGEMIVSRDSTQILLRGERTPKLSSHQSVLSTLKEEESISHASKSFERILYSDQTASVATSGQYHFVDFTKLSRKLSTLSLIRESAVPTIVKLALCSVHAKSLFSDIRERFVEIFPYVEDVKMEPRQGDDVPSFMRELPLLSIREQGVQQWIAQQDISSGMFRTMMHLAELFLSPEGTVILIDEFENSLGVNCIDVVTADLLNESRKIQFIVTSHHPYVINNIGVEYWKIVSRKGPVVTTRDAKDYQFGESSHDAFMQLINLDHYKDGITAS